jgi:predicted dehydrogenase
MSLRVAVCGLGFMGRTHIAAYGAAAAAGFTNRLVAVADRNADRRAGRLGGGGNLPTGEDRAAFDPAAVRGYAAPEDLAMDPEIDLVSICTPTPTHVALAERCLRAGKHVLIEKPVALDSGSVRRLRDLAATTGKLCMPAHCMRFWPGWSELAVALQSGQLGPVRSAIFRRLAARPNWSQGFYGDVTKTGGALFDLHVHDADFVRHCFGEPRSLFVRGAVDHVVVAYDVERVPLVVAEGGWDLPANHRFEMAYEVVGERETWRYELTSEGPRLEIFSALDAPQTPPRRVPLAAETGYELEIRALLAAIAAGRPAPIGIEEALKTVELLERIAGQLPKPAGRS